MDLHYNVKYRVAVAPQNPTGTGTLTGIVIDRAGFDAVEFIVQNGAVSGAQVLTPIVFEGSATGSLASVANGDLLGTESGAVLSGGSSDNMTGKIGYTGDLRYVRCDLTVAGVATGYPAVLCALGKARKGPQSDQTV